VGAIVAAPCLAALPAQAAASTIYVSPSGAAGHNNTSCAQAKYKSIQAAVDSVAVHGTVVVCAGSYHQTVTINKSLTLAGRTGSVINAKGFPYGVGMTASYVTVTGLTVENAGATANDPNDGIITAGFGAMGPVPGNHETIVGNNLKNNAGAGIDLNSTSWSVARNNVANNNGIGINMSDDLGKPASHNQVLSNIANNNPGGCGIVLADHTGVGIFANLVDGNTANYNGLGTPSAPNASSGSGIILAGGSGGVYNNTVSHNFFSGNGHGGVALHAHAPGLNFSGNQILANTIGPNNVRTDFADLKTTGIYLGDVTKLSIKILGNTFRNSFYGIFVAGPVTVNGFFQNGFFSVTHPGGSVAKYAG
jgi:parallel beta-helix repeat protein